MKTRFKLILFLLALFTGISQLPAMESASTKLPAKLKKLVLTITDNGSGKRLEAIKPIAAYLSKELKLEVVTVSAKKSTTLLEQMKAGQADVGFINSFGYVLGVSDSLPITPLVITGGKDGVPSTYNSCIISAADKGIKNMDELLANAQYRSFMFVNPTSTSGHLVPRLFLIKQGIAQAETAFKDLSFSGDHYTSLQKVLAGEVDAGAMAYNILQAKIEAGEVNKNDLNILWVSEPITQTPVIMNSGLDKQLQKKIRKAFLQLHEKDPALWQHVQENFSAHDATNFVTAKDEHYNSIRNISGSIEDLLFILNYYLD
ncbi:phosphate/phosphite/phosphonate ABC transporter substrate-binding protein [Nafulsella turpanensis]|uniref:phosphate/phosphite/phosphonate ABC transporter substrate-binding protein n=1 Tax=Nafulsella turpanensis TaxID=1265690 RepID=UPI00034CADD1|nr:phosphate/phosphite/phosphonate ABC transporter substrate-binding protein [Nafulsella turpanensis]